MQEYSAEHGAKSTPGGAPARVWRARVFAAFAVLLPGLSLTILSGQYLAQQAEEQRRSDFEHQVSVATRNISSAVQRYTDFLYAYRAFFNASDTVSRAEFADYMMSLQRSERYPGIQALSFARALGHHQRGEFERTVRAELQQYTSELPDFVIHPPGIHPESYVIEYTEPLRQNARSLGLDLATERQRLISVQRARDTATPIATGMIQLLQDDERKPALAWRLALYKSRQLPLSVSERRRDFHGVVNAVVIIDKLLSGVLSGKLRDRLHLHIYDKSPDTGAERLIYASNQSDRAPAASGGEIHTDSKLVELDIGGRSWMLAFHPRKTGLSESWTSAPYIAAAAGIITTLLLFLLIQTLLTRGQRASVIAERMTAQLRESTERIQVMADTVPVSILILDPDTRNIISMNERAMQWLNKPAYQANSRCLYDLLGESKRLESVLNAALSEGESLEVELEASTHAGKSNWMQASANTTTLGGRKVILLSLSDISERKQAEDRIRYMAHYDALTGLPNRNLMNERIDYLMAQARRDNECVAILLLDLDRFKDVNDTLGHGAGDELLTIFAQRLQKSVRETDMVARLGGDEFIVIVPKVAESLDLAVLAEKLIAKVSLPCTVSGHELHPTTSAGIAIYPQDGDNREHLLGNADAAMYHAKSQGRNRFQFFTRDMNIAVQARVNLERDLRNAFESSELQVHYQPQVDAQSGRMIGMEALMRWVRADSSSISPVVFIPVAEDTGLINRLGHWIMSEACRQGRIWMDEFGAEIRMAVNISPKQLLQNDFLDRVQSVLEETGFPARLLEIEITESALIEQQEKAIAILSALHQQGISIAIDDFGTGYSSLSYLKRFPIDCIKIDRSFVHEVESNTEDQSIITAIIGMAENLGLRLIAEGVESASQLEFLRKHAVGELQGYYFARPMPAQQIQRYIGITLDRQAEVIPISTEKRPAS